MSLTGQTGNQQSVSQNYATIISSPQNHGVFLDKRHQLDYEIVSVEKTYPTSETLDINSGIHFPGDQYLGPGTNVIEKILQGVQPNGHNDYVAQQHDIDYLSNNDPLGSDISAIISTDNSPDGLALKLGLGARVVSDLLSRPFGLQQHTRWNKSETGNPKLDHELQDQLRDFTVKDPISWFKLNNERDQDYVNDLSEAERLKNVLKWSQIASHTPQLHGLQAFSIVPKDLPETAKNIHGHSANLESVMHPAAPQRGGL